MIEIKRNCSSSVRNDPVKKQIVFGDFTIRFDDHDAEIFDLVMIELHVKPVEVLESLLMIGIDYWADRAGEKL